MSTHFRERVPPLPVVRPGAVTVDVSGREHPGADASTVWPHAAGLLLRAGRTLARGQGSRFGRVVGLSRQKAIGTEHDAVPGIPGTVIAACMPLLDAELPRATSTP
ncbi:hypothetical protein LQL77_29790 [Rhodococcus cerastii]|nr:hypothetical protein [Rhodococcus cerastii]